MTTNNLGVGVMIRMLGGYGNSHEVITKAIGKTISKLGLDVESDVLRFEFEDGSKMQLRDSGQSCCEHRYMRTDDTLSDYIGAKFLGVEIKDAPSIETEYDVHEVQFLEIQTSRGVFTMSNHNEHNGYYGGFSIEAEEC